MDDANSIDCIDIDVVILEGLRTVDVVDMIGQTKGQADVLRLI